MDDDIKVNITVKPIYIERVIYWLIIIALAVGIVFFWMESQNCTVDKASLATPTSQATATPPPPAPAPIPTPTATCTDATKNQDETDIDCGGSCAIKCSNNKGCKVDDDCIGDICVNSTCMSSRPVVLSGKLTLDITRVDYTVSNSTGGVKVLGITYKISNGLADDLSDSTLQIFLKTKSNTFCLNQKDDDFAKECYDAFATVTLESLKSGENVTEDHTFTKEEALSSWVLSVNHYNNGDDFNVVAYLKDPAGDDPGGKIVSDALLVNP